LIRFSFIISDYFEANFLVVRLSFTFLKLLKSPFINNYKNICVILADSKISNLDRNVI